MKAHVPGFPRIGARRELKTALEAYWAGRLDLPGLEAAGRTLRVRHWQLQATAGLDFVAVGDFSFYDPLLDHSARLGVVPPRFGAAGTTVDLDTRFRMARGRAPCGHDAIACELTKWFDTNYHYLVPELAPDQEFRLACHRLQDEVREALSLGHVPKPVLPGPLTFLWLAKTPGAPHLDRLQFLDRLLPVYGRLLDELAALGVTWVQIDEPVLALDLPRAWQGAFERAYHRLQRRDLNILLATYYGPLEDNLWTVSQLPVAGLHIDVTRSGDEWRRVLDRHAGYKVLSLGVVDARNVWRNDLPASATLLREAHARLGDRLWVASSASLQHVPVDLDLETGLDPQQRFVLAFAQQKLGEVRALRDAVLHPDSPGVRATLATAARAAEARRRLAAPDTGLRTQLAALAGPAAATRAPYAQRAALQQARLQLPPLPTTTIGSFPQTPEIRRARAAHRAGELDEAGYQAAMAQEIAATIRFQEEAGLDVLVHGEAERNDMVEYFGERLDGMLVTGHGWVQSYGSRCVKPPVILGDVRRRGPLTVDWARYAQSLTARPVKGMLTGPVTLLCWSFPRDDLPRPEIARQLALAVREETLALEAAGIAIIQVDEPAFREGLPLRRSAQAAYWQWAVHAFRLATAGVRADTQIHTHMCYAEFNDCVEHIAALDADVITVETARSAMELLDAFARFDYPNAIGPGVYDIHSPRVPAPEAMRDLLLAAARVVPPSRLWVNPDCGLKTRQWPETRAALTGMVAAARALRAELA